jgi:uncharacterized protein
MRWAAANRSALLTTDYVLDETLTLMRARRQRDIALDFGRALFGPNPPALVRHLSRTEVASAWQVFERFADKDRSFTDCTSKVVIESLGIQQAFAFDQHFRQFGAVAVVP